MGLHPYCFCALGLEGFVQGWRGWGKSRVEGVERSRQRWIRRCAGSAVWLQGHGERSSFGVLL
ncbi:MAG: hypothetical protein HC795_17660 [Coleofasciculaceae cyanobacterium RL_1_1]|nr:hypothetical protein [Coleofasciculaceae cyanobacterium RL_1_1]